MKTPKKTTEFCLHVALINMTSLMSCQTYIVRNQMVPLGREFKNDVH